MSWTERDYLGITVDQARSQWLSILTRSEPPPGKKQVAYLPVETLLVNAATLVIKANSFGGANIERVGKPIPSLANLLKRTPSSVLRKMANIDGSQKNGARHDQIVGLSVTPASEVFSTVYQVIFAAARWVGIDNRALPDFLGIEVGGGFEFLGQEKLSDSSIEEVFGRETEQLMARQPELSEAETEALFTITVRRGQHRFTAAVLDNCGEACVFCGMTSPQGAPVSLLIASHIKPWSQSNNRERLDYQNGLAACPTHDKAFDTGLMTVTRKLEVQLSPRLQEHLDQDPAARAAFGSPPLRSVIEFNWQEKRVANKYLSWHGERIFQTN